MGPWYFTFFGVEGALELYIFAGYRGPWALELYVFAGQRGLVTLSKLSFLQVEDAIQTSPCGEKTPCVLIVCLSLFCFLRYISYIIFLFRGHPPVPKSSHFLPHNHSPRTGSEIFLCSLPAIKSSLLLPLTIKSSLLLPFPPTGT